MRTFHDVGVVGHVVQHAGEADICHLHTRTQCSVLLNSGYTTALPKQTCVLSSTDVLQCNVKHNPGAHRHLCAVAASSQQDVGRLQVAVAHLHA